MKKILIFTALFSLLWPSAWSVETSGPPQPYYSHVLPGGWTVSFFGSQLVDSTDEVVFCRKDREVARFKVPSGNSRGAIVVDEISGRVVMGIQMDGATFALKMCDLETNCTVDIDMSVLLGTIDAEFPEPGPDDYIGHCVVQRSALKLEDGKVLGTARESGTLGDMHYDLYVPFSINIRQPWPEAGRKAVMTVGKASLEGTPDPDPAGKAPRMK